MASSPTGRIPCNPPSPVSPDVTPSRKSRPQRAVMSERAWANRVMGIATVPAGQLLANEANWRIHSAEQQTLLRQILAAVGFVQGVIVNRRSSPAWGSQQHVETIVDGHLRVLLALDQGEETPVPVVYVDLEPEEERLVLTTFDPVGALAGRDDEKLAELVASVPEDLAAIVTALHPDVAAVTDEPPLIEGARRYYVVVECDDEAQQRALLARFAREGLRCRARWDGP